MNASTLTPDSFMAQQDTTLTPDSFMAQQQRQAAQPRGLGDQVVQWLHNTFAPRSAADMPDAKPPTGEMPGSFEGHPENVGEYIPRTAGEMAGGVKDIARGDIAKGAHRIISGAGEGIAPVTLPFAAAAAPAATAVAMGTGAAGQAVGKETAKALGASEDQSDLAGDITGLAAGYGGSKVAPYVKPVSGALAKGYAKKLIPEDAITAFRAVRASQSGAEGEPLISDTPLGPDNPDPDLLKARSLTTANTPASAPASQTGEALGQIKRGSIAQAFNSQSRTLPGQISPEVIKPPTAPTAQPIPPRSGLALPAAPTGAELSDLPTTGAKSAAQTGEALGQIPLRGTIAAAMKPEVKPFTRGSLPQMLQEQLNRSLGGTELNPKVPLRQQLDSVTGAKSSADIPEGHTPVQSSALRSFKYDPAAKEFHARYASGDATTHVFGGVEPGEAQTFEATESKGKAMQQIKQSHPLVAKIVNGKRLPVVSLGR